MTTQVILDEWEGGCFYTDEYLAEAYSEFLVALLDASEELKQDPRVPAFLKSGFEAYVREQGQNDPQADITLRMAMSMVGEGVTTRSKARAPRPATPPLVKDTRSPSPATPRPATPPGQPGPSKRAREEEEGEEGGEEEREGEEEGPTLEVLQTRERHLRRFKTTFREETILIKGLGASLPSEQLMEDMFDAMLDRQREEVLAKEDDRVILEIENATNAENPLWFSMRRADQINGRVVLDKLGRVLNSNQSFMANGQLKISYIHIPLPEKAGVRPDRLTNATIDEWLAIKIKSSTIYSPDNTDDNMCLARSVAVAKARGSMHRQAFYKMKKPNSIPQQREALALCRMAQIDPQQRCGLDEVRKLQDALPDYRLCVFTDKRGRECVFKGPYASGRKNVSLLLHNQHFYAILSPCPAFGHDYFCEKCVLFYAHAGEHRCPDDCWRCRGPLFHDDPTLKRCATCFHFFAGQECYDNHMSLKLPHSDMTQCQAFRFCTLCNTSYSTLRRGKHMCGFVYCQFCKQNVLENHLCYMKPWTGKEIRKKWKYVTIYYDIETTQCDRVDGQEGTFEHKPNLLVCQAVCQECVTVPQNDYFCNVCKTRQHIFHNLDNPNLNVMTQFFDYLRSFPSKTELLLVAHNAKSFDAIFVLQEVIARKIKPELVLQGQKIISMKIGHWKFIDSLMFLPMPLSVMPKSFGLEELKKGYWPYLANTPENYGYEGALLSKELYCVSGMKSKALADFNTWYDGQVAKNVVFNFRRELIDYCISDVTILRQACQAFRQLFNDAAGFDPMFHCITLSSACMAAYRRNFLPADKIGIVPAGGYHGRGKQSHMALQWLDYEAFKLGRKIKTIHTDREIAVFGRRVDGYVELPLPVFAGVSSEEKRIYQFHGCYWHHCPHHFPTSRDADENKYKKTKELTSFFRNSGYTVIEKWECEFKQELGTDPEVKAYFKAHPFTLTPPLVLRDALAGGRTSALRWYHKADLAKGETIKMADVISEYPNANLRGSYPYGHPEIFIEGDPMMPRVDQWNGIIKCTILPPRDLFLPVLPYKARGKLMFPLCRTCVETESKELCLHDRPVDRQITGTWCAPELQLAVLQKGYQLITVHEVYQYPGTMTYDPKTGEDGLLSAYVRRFMALKIQASGWPPEVDTPSKMEQFEKEVLEWDGCILDPQKMKKNPALRTLAKLILNSFWGKFGEKTLRSKTELIYDYAQLMTLVSDPYKVIQSLQPLGEDCLQLSWKPVEESEESLPSSSLLLAAFTTCFGRLQLYRYLDIVKERTLYHDTDSAAYISRPGEPDLPLGSHLGDLTDQVAEDYGPGSFITEFVAGGPKNYAYKVAVGGDTNNIKVCIKVRGISINKSCDELVTFENLKSMVLGERDNINVRIPRQIARLPGWRIVTRPTSKNWQANNTKRRRTGVVRTVPYGYNVWHEQDTEDQEVLEDMHLLMDSEND